MYPEVSTNVYIPIYEAICLDITTSLVQIPLIGQVLALLVDGYCFFAISFISLFPLQAFGLVPPPYFS
jgi:hypothetical protein